MAVYAGLPAAINDMFTVKEVFEERDVSVLKETESTLNGGKK